jgi:hypothetical protein
MIITKIALTTIIAMVVLAFTIVAFAEEFKPRKWYGLSAVDKALTVCILVAGVAAVVGVFAIIWGL